MLRREFRFGDAVQAIEGGLLDIDVLARLHSPLLSNLPRRPPHGQMIVPLGNTGPGEIRRKERSWQVKVLR